MNNQLPEPKKFYDKYLIFPEGRVLLPNGNPLKLSKSACGYYNLNVNMYGKHKTFLLHRVIAILFIENPMGLAEVNHKDGNKLNNHVSNLEWISREGNIRHGYDTGLIKSPWLGKKGEEFHLSKKVLQCDMQWNEIKIFGSIREAERETGAKSIDRVLNGTYKTAGGYKWKYA